MLQDLPVRASVSYRPPGCQVGQVVHLPGGGARWGVRQVGISHARLAVRQVGQVVGWLWKSRWHVRQVGARWASRQVCQVGLAPGGRLLAAAPEI